MSIAFFEVVYKGNTKHDSKTRLCITGFPNYIRFGKRQSQYQTEKTREEAKIKQPSHNDCMSDLEKLWGQF